VLLLVMAWSPPALSARIVWVSAPGDYATFNSNHTPDRTLRKVAHRLNGYRRRPSPIALANHARNAREWELAVRYYRDALNLKPDKPGIWVQYGHALTEAGKVSEAEVAYRRALEIDANDADTNAALGQVLVLQGKSEEAAAG
jgi:Flp pilus assembly protein TadD